METPLEADTDSRFAAAPSGPSSTPFSGENSLVARLRAGDEAAFETLVREHGGRLLATARRFLRSEEDARDAVQEAFLSAFRALPGFAENSSLSTWLHRIVINASLMKLRSRKRKAEESIENLLPRFVSDGHQAEPSSAWEGSAETLLARSETRSLVRRSIDRLPETHRAVLLLRDIEELSTEECARLLGVTENAVKIRLHRARQALRGLLDPHFRRVLSC
jgi:RNA polymerase sigma-70 factor, ECF subfamily